MNLKLSIFILSSLFSVAQANQCRHIFNQERTSYFEQQLSGNDFVVNRGLKHYAEIFSAAAPGFAFEKFLSQLPKNSVWLDMGAGKAYAILEGLYDNPHIKGVGISYKKPEHRNYISEVEDLVGQRFEYLDGDYVENMALAGRLDRWDGKVKVITDVYGPFSYGEDLARILQIYVNLLSRKGQMLLHLSNYKTSLVKRDSQKQYSVIDWLKSIKGLQVNVIKSTKGTYEQTGDDVEVVSLQVIKLTPRVKVPQNLILKVINYGRPSWRLYQWK